MTARTYGQIPRGLSSILFVIQKVFAASITKLNFGDSRAQSCHWLYLESGTESIHRYRSRSLSWNGICIHWFYSCK